MNASLTSVSKKKQPDGFTLMELLVIIATIAVLAMLLLPALAGTRPNSDTFQCRNNQRQIILAWQMYATDNNDLLPPNDWYTGPPTPPQPYFGPTRNQWNWVGGSVDFNPSNTQNTNTLNLVQRAALGAYNTNAGTYHCPADPRTVAGLGPRVRSVTMNLAVGTIWNTAKNSTEVGRPVIGPWLDGNYRIIPSLYWQTYDKLSSMVNPTPANLFVITDENPDSINDPVMNVGLGAPDVNGNATFTSFIDSPGSYHNGAGTFAFADGRVETHRWIGSRVKLGGNFIPAGDSLDDLRWLQQRTTAIK